MASSDTNATEHESLSKKVRDFQTLRDKAAKDRLQKVTGVSKRFFIAGLPLYAAGLVLRRVPGMDVAGCVVLVCSAFTMVTGLVVGSTCSMALTDVDAHALLNVAIGLGLASLSTVTVLGEPWPYGTFHAIPALCGLATAASSCSPVHMLWRATTAMAAWIGVGQLAWTAEYFWLHVASTSEWPVDGARVSQSYGFLCLACLKLTFALWIVIGYVRCRIQYRDSVSSTTIPLHPVYYATYVHFLCAASTNLCKAVFLAAAQQHHWLSVFYATFALAFATPVALVCVVGRDRLFHVVARRHEQNSSQREQDGAFVASLLEQHPFRVGESWWVHRAAGDQDTRYPEGDHRRNWSKGCIVDAGPEKFDVKMEKSLTKISFSHFGPKDSLESQASIVSKFPSMPSASLDFQAVCRLPSTTSIRSFPMAARGSSWDEILLQARRNLRCIDWDNVTEELMKGAVCGTADENLQGNLLFDMSRPVRPGEHIDFFLSHSWHDDAVAKWAALKQAVEHFNVQYGRAPTFWLDKTCIDQTRIGDGLRALPVNIMACRKVLILCGDTYAVRLWCIWELFVLLAFTDLKMALERMLLVPLVNDGCKRLSNFRMADAHCYDPNEESKLRFVINSIGSDVFTERVHMLAEALSSHVPSKKPYSMETRSNGESLEGRHAYISSSQVIGKSSGSRLANPGPKVVEDVERGNMFNVSEGFDHVLPGVPALPV